MWDSQKSINTKEQEANFICPEVSIQELSYSLIINFEDDPGMCIGINISQEVLACAPAGIW